MIFQKLRLHNFGVYRGEQVFDLAPRDNRSIVLFMGKNGTGKTTFATAIRFALYGPRAFRLRAGALPSKLQGLIHDGEVDSRVELTLIANIDGNDRYIALRRQWSKRKNLSLSISIDGKRSLELEECWSDFVETILPFGVAPLVIFDGERVEALASPSESASAIRNSIYGLVGLEVLERLCADLKRLERKEDASTKETEDEGDLGVAPAKELLRAAKEELPRVRRCLEEGEQELNTVEYDLERAGGDIYLGRLEIEASAKAKAAEILATEDLMRDLAAGGLPLILLGEHRVSSKMHVSEKVLRWLVDRDKAAIAKAGGSQLLKEYLHQTRQELGCDGAVEATDFPRWVADAKAQIEKAMSAKRELDILERKLSSIPSEESIRPLVQRRTRLIAERDRLAAREGVLTEEVASLKARVKRLQEKEDARALEQAKREYADCESLRIQTYSMQARGKLRQFIGRLLTKSLAKIEDYVFARFQELTHKEHLFKGLSIDPDTFEPTLQNDTGQISASRLSAGERQMLAIALLWGLSDTAEKALPMVVDTPLGRLDADHRRAMLRKYFPKASHQELNGAVRMSWCHLTPDVPWDAVRQSIEALR